jgi:type 1 glutamine amidotransferase
MTKLFLFNSIFLFLLELSGAPRHIAFLVGERQDSAEQTIPSLAAELEKELGCTSEYIHIPKHGKSKNLKNISNADLIVLFLSLRNLPPEQIKLISAHLDKGKPAIALRSSMIAFQKQPNWFPKYFGAHFGNTLKQEGHLLEVSPLPATVDHPTLQGFSTAGFRREAKLYIPQLMAAKAQPLLMARLGDHPAVPVAWTHSHRERQRLLYCSLGSEEDFRDLQFRRFLKNAVSWSLGEGELLPLPSSSTEAPPPELNAPEGAEILFNGQDLSNWESIDPNQYIEPLPISAGLKKFRGRLQTRPPLWKMRDGTLESSPGHGDLITVNSYTDYQLHLDFFLPEEPQEIQSSFRGNGGIYINGLYEIHFGQNILPEKGKGSLYGLRSPISVPELETGRWHSLDLTCEAGEGNLNFISVLINGQVIHNQVSPERPSPYSNSIFPQRYVASNDKSLFSGSLSDSSKKLRFDGKAFSVAVRFKSNSSAATLFARKPADKEWAKLGKALFINHGALHYDIGQLAVMESSTKVNDGKWHQAVLTDDLSVTTLYIDGKPDFMRGDFTYPDNPEHIFKIGYHYKDSYKSFPGEISEVRYYDYALSEEQIAQLNLQLPPLYNPLFQWSHNPSGAPVLSRPTPFRGGPIRLKSDFSKVRYANIWILEKN